MCLFFGPPVDEVALAIQTSTHNTHTHTHTHTILCALTPSSCEGLIVQGLTAYLTEKFMCNQKVG